MEASEVLENPNDIIALNHKLELAQLELRHSREFHALQIESVKTETTALRGELSDLRSTIGIGLSTSLSIAEILASAIANSQHILAETSKENIAALVGALERNNQAEGIEAIENIKNNDPGLFKIISDLVLKGAVSGASGNYLFQWLNMIGMILL